MLPDPRIWTCGSRKRSSRCARQRSVTDWASPDFRPGRLRVPAVPGPASTVPARDWYSAPGRGSARGAAGSGASASASAFAAWASCAAARASAWVRDPGGASGSGSSVQKGDVASWLKSLLIRKKTVSGSVITSTEAACTCWRPLRIRDMFGAVVGCSWLVEGEASTEGWGMEDGGWKIEDGGWRGGRASCVVRRGAGRPVGQLLGEYVSPACPCEGGDPFLDRGSGQALSREGTWARPSRQGRASSACTKHDDCPQVSPLERGEKEG
jgi:hypothetical protein